MEKFLARIRNTIRAPTRTRARIDSVFPTLGAPKCIRGFSVDLGKARKGDRLGPRPQPGDRIGWG